MTTPQTVPWTSTLSDQLEWHWANQLRPRLSGLTDEEYFWEPVPCWSLRADGTGSWRAEYAFPEPDPPPVTTIAWRLAHVIVGVLAMRNASHFGAPAADYETWRYAATAEQALAQLDEQYATWISGVHALDDEGLAHPCGPAEGPFGELPMAALVLHIHREVIHHGAEISLLRDLYRASGGRSF
jgi:hypothetical protein